ncbi:MAG TPA: GNAT family N-acetyltransferase [Acidimicrobiales bacterium]|nr:GNAT family N-acetyltransferase [Acidimicrobiales bacterium]
MPDYEVVVLDDPGHRQQAAGVAARALRDNPTTLAVSADPFVRFDMLYGTFARSMPHVGDVTGAMRGDCVLAVATTSVPGDCIATMLPAALRVSKPPADDATDMDRFLFMGSVMAANDLPDDHWHVGPVGVEPGFQGRGLGHAVMELLCNRLDDRRGTAWLETDRPENVRFYLSLGFELMSEEPMLGATFWFLRREPR